MEAVEARRGLPVVPKEATIGERLVLFNEKAKKRTAEVVHGLLLMVGTIGATVCGILYLTLVCMLVFGVNLHSMRFWRNVVFILLSSCIGVLIAFMFRLQGISFAREEGDNKALEAEYHGTRTRDKKITSIRSYWVQTTLTDIVTKGLLVGLFCMGSFYLALSLTLC